MPYINRKDCEEIHRLCDSIKSLVPILSDYSCGLEIGHDKEIDEAAIEAAELLRLIQRNTLGGIPDPPLGRDI